MAIPTASTTESLDTLRTRARFASARMKSDPNAQAYAPQFVAFLAAWTVARDKEQAIDDAVTDAQAGEVFADGNLDELVDRVAATIQGAKKRNPNSPVQQLYFGNLTAAKLRRPVLGAELDRVRLWPALLTASADPQLRALATGAGSAASTVAAADAAAAALVTALSARDAFRKGGERQKIFDAYNSLCATTYGKLKAFVHDHPELRLPPGYADSFFLHGLSPSSSAGSGSVGATAKAAETSAAKAALDKARHDAAVAKAAAAKLAKQERDASKAKAAAAKAIAAEATKAARAAELAAKAKRKPAAAS